MNFIKRRMFLYALILFLFFGTIGIKGDVITIYSSPDIDGEIAYHPWVGLYTSTTWWEMTSADWWNWGDMVEQYARSYFSFDISTIDSGSSINSAELCIYQSKSVGNSQEGVFPQWTNVPGGETLFCIADHIDYGSTLDTTDWTAGDPGDPQTIETNVGLVSNSAELGYRVLGGLGYCVQEDLNAARGHIQFRVRFPIDTDDDNESDFLRFLSGDSDSLKPYLEVDFTPASVEHSVPQKIVLNRNFLKIYPNPVKSNALIKYNLKFPTSVRVSIYDVDGRCIKILSDSFHKKGVHTVIWDGTNDRGNKVPSGLYFCRLKVGKYRAVRKIIKLY